MATVKKNAARATGRVQPKPGAGYCVYIGPSIRASVQYGQILHGTIADAKEALKPVIDRWPLIGAMIIPGELLSEARIKVKTHGTALNDQYTRLVRALAREEGR